MALLATIAVHLGEPPAEPETDLGGTNSTMQRATINATAQQVELEHDDQRATAALKAAGKTGAPPTRWAEADPNLTGLSPAQLLFLDWCPPPPDQSTALLVTRLHAVTAAARASAMDAYLASSDSAAALLAGTNKGSTLLDELTAPTELNKIAPVIVGGVAAVAGVAATIVTAGAAAPILGVVAGAIEGAAKSQLSSQAAAEQQAQVAAQQATQAEAQHEQQVAAAAQRRSRLPLVLAAIAAKIWLF